MDKLAINGGKPVRTKPFPSAMPGASLIGKEELTEIADVIENKSPFRFYGIGKSDKVETFEKEINKRFGVKFSLAVSSGSSALLCAIAALGLGPGDEVIIPSFSWYSDYCALIAFGVSPVFADIGDDLNLDPSDFEKKITDKTKAVIIVSYQGCPAKMDKLMDVAERHGIKVIEDVAQAFGCSFKGKLLGTFGDIAITSFQTHKLMTCGEGGMVLTNNEDYFVRAVRYHDLGLVRPFFHSQLSDVEKASEKYAFSGLQLRMSELQGACLLGQLKKFDLMFSTLRKHHERLRKAMSKYKSVKVRYEDGMSGNAFIMLLDDADTAKAFSDAMTAEGIPCGPTSACCNLMRKGPISNRGLVNPKLPPFGQGYDYENVSFHPDSDCVNTDKIVARFVAIGLGPLFSDEDISDIICALDKVSTAMAL